MTATADSAVELAARRLERAVALLEQRLAHLRENLRTPGLRDEFDEANRFRKGQ